MKKSIFSILAITTLGLFLINPVLAAPKDEKGEIKTEIKKSKEELRPTGTAKMKQKFANIVGGQVTGIAGLTLTVSKDSKTYTVNTTGSTRFRRHFWGQSSITEISVGDNVNIWGKWADDNQTSINATMVRDTSIQKRKGVFVGTVVSKDASSFVLQTINRGDQTVTIDSSTKFKNRKEQTMTFSDLSTSDKVRVRGLWDATLSKITDVKEVKDFSRPVIVAPTPKK